MRRLRNSLILLLFLIGIFLNLERIDLGNRIDLHQIPLLERTLHGGDPHQKQATLIQQGRSRSGIHVNASLRPGIEHPTLTIAQISLRHKQRP